MKIKESMNCENFCSKKTVLSDKLVEQVKVIDESLEFILLILFAVGLNYYSTSIQRKQLICTEAKCEECKCLPDTFPAKLAANLLVLWAILFFFGLSEENLNTPAPDCVTQKSNQMNYFANLLVLIAAFIRLFDLFLIEKCKTGNTENFSEIVDELDIY